ncbi:MAG: Sodium:galactoside symporter family protein [uncultured Sphingomonadaceae bacterium]|uniref:Sodium:galactoside symporter family protein n=1 Tax=uncultured Sphingomonadaceae bacterium TaxID=169976 RepID=A0A6J4SZD3_9SPHN|nr:MAG: Sodium:galactoside symporter family protein [uncultured Sphingomonadaceae bacterium]
MNHQAAVGSSAAPVAAVLRSPKTWRDKVAYGFGSIAFGVKDNGFTYLLMIFYNQALGLPARTVGLAVMIALIVDAMLDPLIGNWSDHFRSKWGRRHPFMYAAALPVAVSFYFLWNPPEGLSQTGLFWYLLVSAIVIRACITCYEIPSSALVADLSKDYDERTSFLSYRFFFGWFGGLLLGVLAFSVFLVPSERYPVGQQNLDGYAAYGLTASFMMLAAILVSAWGTHRHIPEFDPAPPKRPFDLRRALGEVRQTLANRPFLSLLGYILAANAAVGVTAALVTYGRLFFWELTSNQISFLLLANFLSIFVAFWAAPRLARAAGKKMAAIIFTFAGMVGVPLAYLLRLLDVLPADGPPLLLAILFVMAGVFSFLVMSAGVVASSMLADVVEDSQRDTGRSSAGLFFSASAFVLKCVSGIGIFASGVILDLVAFPEGAKAGEVPEAVLRNLVLTEMPVVLVLQLLSLLALLAYPINRARHEANLRSLRAHAGGHRSDDAPADEGAPMPVGGAGAV